MSVTRIVVANARSVSVMNEPMKKKKTIKKWHWPFLRVNSGGVREYACRHKVGHGGIHGCDGCCATPDYFEAIYKRLTGRIEKALMFLGTGECEANKCEGCKVDMQEAIASLKGVWE